MWRKLGCKIIQHWKKAISVYPLICHYLLLTVKMALLTLSTSATLPRQGMMNSVVIDKLNGQRHVISVHHAGQNRLHALTGIPEHKHGLMVWFPGWRLRRRWNNLRVTTSTETSCSRSHKCLLPLAFLVFLFPKSQTKIKFKSPTLQENVIFRKQNNQAALTTDIINTSVAPTFPLSLSRWISRGHFFHHLWMIIAGTCLWYSNNQWGLKSQPASLLASLSSTLTPSLTPELIFELYNGTITLS